MWKKVQSSDFTTRTLQEVPQFLLPLIFYSIRDVRNLPTSPFWEIPIQLTQHLSTQISDTISETSDTTAAHMNIAVRH